MVRSLLVFALASLVATPVLAGRLADLPWDSTIPRDVRQGVFDAMGEIVAELKKESKDEDGKTWVFTYPSNYIEIRDGKPVTWMTIWRTYEERMVAERWEYIFEEKADGEYELQTETKVAEDAGALALKIDDPTAPRPLEPFEFEHDLFTLEMTSGEYLVFYVDDKPTRVLISGTGRTKIRPLDDYQAQFFDRKLGTTNVDTAVSQIDIDINEGDEEILDLLGYDGPADNVVRVDAVPDDIGLDEIPEDFKEMYDWETIKRYSPSYWAYPETSRYAGKFSIGMKTSDHDDLYYAYDPTAAEEIVFANQSQTALTLQGDRDERGQLISMYPGPDTRELTLDEQEGRLNLRYAIPNAYQASFDIDADRLVGTVSVELTILEATDRLAFPIFGSKGRLRYVRDYDTNRELPFTKSGPVFTFALPREVKPGESLRLEISYNAPDLVRKIDEGFWRVSRGGLLPFYQIIGDPAFMHFVMRTDKAYNHVGFGREISREVDGDFLMTEWSADHSILFPTMIVGKFFDPVVAETDDGIKIVGYPTNPVNRDYTRLAIPQKAMQDEVEKARSSMQFYNQTFGVRYPFEELKIISVPNQGFAQAPTTILYMDETLLLPPSVMAQFNVDPRKLQSVTAHEASHQWWGGLVSNVNSLHYWFVEGFAEFASAFYQDRVTKDYLDLAVQDWREDVFLSDHVAAVQDDGIHFEPVPAPPLRYTKGPLVVMMMGEYFGYDKLFEYMQTVMREHAGDLISTVQLQRIAERVFQQPDLDWYFDQWIRKNGIPTVGYKLGSPRQEGGKWVIDYEFTQRIERKNEVIPDYHFRLRVPLGITKPDGEEVTVYVPLSEKTASGQIPLEFKPRGSIRVNPNDRMLFKKERL
jgi:hypothetical protein